MLRYAIADGDVLTENAINCGHIRQPSKLLNASGIDRSAFRAATREGLRGGSKSRTSSSWRWDQWKTPISSSANRLRLKALRSRMSRLEIL
jgi:hypothetical protein